MLRSVAKLLRRRDKSPYFSWHTGCKPEAMDLSLAYQALEKKLLSWFSATGEMLPNLILALLVFAISWFVAKAVARGLSGILARSKMNRAARELVVTLLRVGVVLLGAVFALGILQLDKALASILAGAGVVGLALGFAFQDLAANLISGVGLAVNREKPFKIGDIIETNDEFGRVKEIDHRTSTLESLDGKLVVIPNKRIYQNKVINHSSTGTRRVDLACGISYGEDLKRVAGIAKKAIESVVTNCGEETQIFWTGFGDSSIDFSARFWVKYDNQSGFLEAKSQAIVALKEAFDEADIMIPFPIRTLDFGIRGGRTLDQVGENLSLSPQSSKK